MTRDRRRDDSSHDPITRRTWPVMIAYRTGTVPSHHGSSIGTSPATTRVRTRETSIAIPITTSTALPTPPVLAPAMRRGTPRSPDGTSPRPRFLDREGASPAAPAGCRVLLFSVAIPRGDQRHLLPSFTQAGPLTGTAPCSGRLLPARGRSRSRLASRSSTSRSQPPYTPRRTRWSHSRPSPPRAGEPDTWALRPSRHLPTRRTHPPRRPAGLPPRAPPRRRSPRRGHRRRDRPRMPAPRPGPSVAVRAS
jgi:hypothetical protein